jgi:O-antigen ligase
MLVLLSTATIAIVSWGVLSFGAVYPWAYWPLAGASALVGLGALLVVPGRPWHERPLALALLVIAAAAALQTIPLPRGLLDAISPGTLRYLESYDLRWAYGLVPTGSHAISLNPAKTWLAIALLAAFGLLLLATARVVAHAGPARLCGGLIVLGTLVALAAIIQDALTSHLLAYDVKIYGFWEPQNRATPYGPFVNRNHYAGWMLMILPVALGFLAGLLETGFRQVRPTLRHRLLWMGSPAGGRAWLLLLSVAVMTLSLLLSESRSGPAAFAIAVAIAGVVVLPGSRPWLRAGAGLGMALLLVTAIAIWAGSDTGLTRFSSVSTEIGARLSAWGDALAIVKAFPIFGTGLNTYGAASLLYQSTSLTSHYREAHNDYLQLAAEGGLLLGIPILLCLWRLVTLIGARFATPDPDRVRYWIRVGATTGLLGIAIQSLVEFSLQMPGNAALFAVLAGVALHPSTPHPESAQ